MNANSLKLKDRRLDLTHTSLIAADSIYVDKTVRAMRYCLGQVRFKNALLFSNRPVELPLEITRISIPPLASLPAYSEFIVRNLSRYQYLFGEYVLIVQHDGFIVNAQAWQDDFLHYDYIGAPWPGGTVGNGGFSLRSRALLVTVSDLQEEFQAVHPEDRILAETYRHRLEAKGIRFAPTALAEKFAVEDTPYQNSFGFHGSRPGCALDSFKADVIDLYNGALCQPSDIHDHLETLLRLGRECAHITELVSRIGESTAAFLAAMPETLATYDAQNAQDLAYLERAAFQANVCFRFEAVNPLEIEPTDLLFIDSFHVYEQTRTELARHASRVQKYLVFHDTATYGDKGEGDGQRGIWPAIQEFLDLEQDWKLAEKYAHNNGLTVLKRIEPHLDAEARKDETQSASEKNSQHDNQRPKIRYIISSHVRYADMTLPILLQSMQTIEPKNIVVVVGGSPEPREECRAGVTFLYVEQNSFDWTGPIEIVKRELAADWWFWLHDTCECGPNFRALAEEGFDPECDMTVVYDGQCNFGMYSYSFLMRQKAHLLSLIGLNKEQGIIHEKEFFQGCYGTKASYANGMCCTLGEADIYNTGIMRLREHYVAVDLYKFKANWGQHTGGSLIASP